MRVLVLSDTHIPAAASALPEKILVEAKKADICLHAGDFIDYSVHSELAKLTTVYAVYGNMDSDTVRNRLPLKQIITLENITIGLTHGRGAPHSIIKTVKSIFDCEFASIDVFVFGHSHKACDTEIEGKIYFNPGSVTDKVFAPYPSYGILEIEGKALKRRLVRLE